MLVALAHDVLVNPEQVASVQISHGGYRSALKVTLIDGQEFTVEPQHNEGVYEAKDRIQALVNQEKA